MEIQTLFNLPAHPLIVHAVVVLVPLVAIGAIAVVIWPAVRSRIGWLVVVGAVLNVVLTPLATGSGEALKDRVGETAVLEEHVELGELLLPWVAALAVLILVDMLLSRRRKRVGEPVDSGTPDRHRWLGGGLLGRPVALLLAALVLGSATGSAVMITLIGHNGAKATWSDTGTQSGREGSGAESSE